MAAPSNLAAPALTGTQEIGFTATCSSGSWDVAVDSYFYQWQSRQPGDIAFADIAGSTGNSYLLLAGDQGLVVRCKVTATNADGATIAYSDESVAIPNDLLIVEDGTGKEDSNTYVDIAYADSYFAVRNNSVWPTYSTGQRKAALIGGASYIELSNFIGTKNTAEQAMQWPRTGAKVDGFVIASDTIPKQLKDAQCEASLRVAAGEIMADIDAGNVTEETVDVITVKYSDYSNAGINRYPAIESLLRKLVTSSGSYHRTVRT